MRSRTSLVITYIICIISAGAFPAPSAGAGDSFTFSQLEQILKQDASSVEAILPRLPLSFRSNTTFIHHSDDPDQHTSFAEPRVAFFNPNLVMTFDSKTQEMRVMEFRPEGNQLHLIHFKEGKADLQPKEILQEKCVRCHLSVEDAKPIWKKYQNWFGAYGSSDDNLVRVIDSKSGQLDEPALTRVLQNLLHPDEVEARIRQESLEYAKFEQSSKGHPRYSSVNFPPGSAVSPYSDAYKGEWLFRPNLRFTKILQDAQAKRLYRQTQRQEDLKTIIPFLLLLQSDCPVPQDKLVTWGRTLQLELGNKYVYFSPADLKYGRIDRDEFSKYIYAERWKLGGKTWNMDLTTGERDEGREFCDGQYSLEAALTNLVVRDFLREHQEIAELFGVSADSKKQDYLELNSHLASINPFLIPPKVDRNLGFETDPALCKKIYRLIDETTSPESGKSPILSSENSIAEPCQPKTLSATPQALTRLTRQMIHLDSQVVQTSLQICNQCHAFRKDGAFILRKANQNKPVDDFEAGSKLEDWIHSKQFPLLKERIEVDQDMPPRSHPLNKDQRDELMKYFRLVESADPGSASHP